MTTLKDIAQATGINAGSVAHVLNNSHKALELREETRKRILATAKALGYCKNEYASAIRYGVSRIVACICDFPCANTAGSDIEPNLGIYANRIISGILSETTKSNFGVKLYSTLNLTDAINSMESYRLKHVVMLGASSDTRKVLADWSRKKGVKLVFVTGEPIVDFPCINTADREGALMAVQRLLGLGHTRIGLISAPLSIYYANERDAGYIKALSEANIVFDKKLVSYAGNDTDIEENIRKLLSMSKNQRPTAFFSTGEFGALLLQRQIIMSGLRFPEDVSIISFGGGLFPRYAIRPLTFVSQPFEEMGAAAVRLSLKSDMARDTNGHVFLPTKLIIGESDGACTGQ